MAVPLSRMLELVDRRVRKVFDHGLETAATLLFATEDMDGSQHLIFDRVEWTNGSRDFAAAKHSTLCAPGETLVSIEAAGEHEV